MKTEKEKVIEICPEELMLSINSIRGLLVLAHYHESRMEMITYLGLISTCILKVEDAIKNASQATVETINSSAL